KAGPPPATVLPPAKAAPREDAELPGMPPLAPRSRGGRRRDSQTAEVYEFCYREYRLKGRKRSAVLREAKARFPASKTPKEEADVTNFATRHADRNGLPRVPEPAIL